MNHVELSFYNAFKEMYPETKIQSQVKIGCYVVDFLIDDVIVEIDGKDYHTTLEQREKDYRRERWLIANGYTVVRFTGAEINSYLSSCVDDAGKICKSIKSFRGKLVSKGMAESAKHMAFWINKCGGVVNIDAYKPKRSVVQ